MDFETFKPARRNVHTWRHWTADDDRVLVEMVDRHESTVAIARHLKRTPRAVTMRIQRVYGGPTGRPRGAAAASNRWRSA